MLYSGSFYVLFCVFHYLLLNVSSLISFLFAFHFPFIIHHAVFKEIKGTWYENIFFIHFFIISYYNWEKTVAQVFDRKKTRKLRILDTLDLILVQIFRFMRNEIWSSGSFSFFLVCLEKKRVFISFFQETRKEGDEQGSVMQTKVVLSKFGMFL